MPKSQLFNIDVLNSTGDGDIMCRNIFGSTQNTESCFLPSRYICDGIDHCHNRTDECQTNCNISFRCDNDTTCLPYDKLHDGNADCTLVTLSNEFCIFLVKSWFWSIESMKSQEFYRVTKLKAFCYSH